MKTYDLIIIGAGPCGIGCGVEAKLNGIKEVLILEKGEDNNQTIRNFYKTGKRVDDDYKGLKQDFLGKVKFNNGTKESVLEDFEKLIKDNNLEISYKSEVEKVQRNADDLLEVFTASENYLAKNVIIAIGKMGKPNKPSYKIPPTLLKKINYDLNSCTKDEDIVVIGGGNSAAEYALELSKNNKVTMAYRKECFARLNPINLEHIEEASKNKKIDLKMCFDVESLEDESGKIKINYKNGQTQICDRIIYAIGGSTPVGFLQKCKIDLDDKGIPLVDDYLQTSIKGLRAGGDIITHHGGSIIIGLNNAYTIIKHIVDEN